MKGTGPRIRPLTAADVELACAWSAREGWTSSREIFEAIVAHGPRGCFVAERSGEPAGIVTTSRFGATGWIGNLIVPPEARRQGIGTHLTRLALDHLRGLGVRTIRLEADPPGVGIYRRLGFEEEVESLRFRYDGSPGPGAEVERLTASRLAEVQEFDRPRFGADRSGYLRKLFERAIAGYICDGGYLLVLPTSTGAHLGPCIADDAKTARRLLEAARHGVVLTAGIPATNRDGATLLEGMGFQRLVSSVRMVLGEPAGAGLIGTVFGIADGATG